MKIFCFLLCFGLPSQGNVTSKTTRETSDDDIQVTLNEEQCKIKMISLHNEYKKVKEENEKLKEEIERPYTKKKEKEEIKKIKSRTAKNCEDWSSFESGKRNIYLNRSHSVKIYCDQGTDCGRWNVFQRRQDGSVNFYRGWSDYRNGFGDIDGEFWLGLETLHQMTNDGQKYELRFDMEKHNSFKYYAVYDDFSIGSESEGYAVHFTGYRGNAGDFFSYHRDMKFTTKDRDNDNFLQNNLAVLNKGAWWYHKGAYSELNQRYISYKERYLGRGIVWGNISTYLEKTEIKFRLKK